MKQTRSEYKRIHSHEEKPILEQWIVSYLEKKKQKLPNLVKPVKRVEMNGNSVKNSVKIRENYGRTVLETYLMKSI